MKDVRTHGVKYLIALFVVILLRLLPHPPNVEPITATLMPFGKQFGWLGGAVFGLLSVVVYDTVTGTLGPWSLLTVFGYVAIGVAAGFYFKAYSGRGAYLGFAVIGTLLYDALTGLTVGPLFFNQSFVEALVGQVPFTLYHLAGNVALALVVSPLIERWIVGNKQLEFRIVSASASTVQ